MITEKISVFLWSFLGYISLWVQSQIIEKVHGSSSLWLCYKDSFVSFCFHYVCLWPSKLFLIWVICVLSFKWLMYVICNCVDLFLECGLRSILWVNWIGMVIRVCGVGTTPLSLKKKRLLSSCGLSCEKMSPVLPGLQIFRDSPDCLVLMTVLIVVLSIVNRSLGAWFSLQPAVCNFCHSLEG